MKTQTCGIISAVVVFAVSLLLLEVEYPWSTYAAFRFSKWVILVSYLAAAFMSAAAAAAATVFCLSMRRGSHFLRAAACCIAMFVSLSVVSVLLGPGGLEVPGTVLGGLFFSEWEFLNFIVRVAAPASVAAGALCAWLARRRSQANLHSTH